MEQLKINRVNFNKLVALVAWTDKAPRWFDTGDRFWDRVNEAQWQLIKGFEPDTDRFEFGSMESGVDGSLYLNVYDNQAKTEVTFEFVPVDI